jgi:hypothetical protein
MARKGSHESDKASAGRRVTLAKIEEVASEKIGIVIKLRLIERFLVVVLSKKACKVYTTRDRVIQPVELKSASVAARLAWYLVGMYGPSVSLS